MNANLILDGIVEKFQSYIEPYNTIEAVPKFNLLRDGQAMCGSDVAFCEWISRTFGKPLAEFPRDMVEELRFWMSGLSIVTEKTLRTWSAMGRAKYPDFDKRQYSIVFSATRKRTKFPPLMTEEETLAMINQWMIGPLPPPVEITPITFLDLERVPQPVYPLALVPAITFSTVEYGCELPPVLHIPVEIDRAPLPADQRRTNRNITVRVETVEESEITVPEHSPYYIMRNLIAKYENYSVEQYTRRRYEVMGTTALIFASVEQLGKYALAIGVPEYTCKEPPTSLDKAIVSSSGDTASSRIVEPKISSLDFDPTIPEIVQYSVFGFEHRVVNGEWMRNYRKAAPHQILNDYTITEWRKFWHDFITSAPAADRERILHRVVEKYATRFSAEWHMEMCVDIENRANRAKKAFGDGGSRRLGGVA